MKYIAKSPGFIFGSRIEKGESFEAKEGLKGKWFVPAAEYVPPPAEKLDDEPKTLSEMSRVSAKGPLARGNKSPI